MPPGGVPEVIARAFVPTAIELEVPVIEGMAASVTVIVLLPTVFIVAAKEAIPFVSVELAGSVA